MLPYRTLFKRQGIMHSQLSTKLIFQVLEHFSQFYWRDLGTQFVKCITIIILTGLDMYDIHVSGLNLNFL